MAERLDRGGVRTIANAATPNSQKLCYQCSEIDFYKRDCKKKDDAPHAAFALSLARGSENSRHAWILDSWASRHLIVRGHRWPDDQGKKGGSSNLLVRVDA